MKNVMLIKGIDYRGHGIFAKNGVEKSVEDDKAEELVATGFFKICGNYVSEEEDDSFGPGDTGDGQSNEDGPGDTGDSSRSPAKMKGDELKAYAEQKGYDISDCTKVEEIRALIIELDKKAKKEEQNNEGNGRS